MTLPELRAFLNASFCGCGYREAAFERLRDLLALHPLYEHQGELQQLLPDDGIRYLVLYMLDHFDLTEHGSGVGGSWLSEKGQEVLDALNREAVDNFETLAVDCCMHGYAIDDASTQCPECSL